MTSCLWLRHPATQGIQGYLCHLQEIRSFLGLLTTMMPSEGFTSWGTCRFPCYYHCCELPSRHHVTFTEPLVLYKLTFGESTTDQDVNPEASRTLFQYTTWTCDSLPLRKNSETFSESYDIICKRPQNSKRRRV